MMRVRRAKIASRAITRRRRRPRAAIAGLSRRRIMAYGGNGGLSRRAFVLPAALKKRGDIAELN